NALVMRYYMDKHNVTREEMSWWAVMMHDNGFKNPFAQLRKKITLEEVMNSPVIADPIRLFDACPLSDGAAALLLVPDDLKSLTDTPVRIAGIGNAVDSPDLSSRFELDRLYASRLSAERAFKIAKKEAKDIDVAEIHDAYSIIAAITIEEIGFAERGQAPKMWAEGRFRPGDKPVLNPSGGLKSRGHPVGATGVYQAAEIVLQLRGDFPGLQVGGEVGLTQNVGGVGSNVTTLIFTR
ncbi:MAG: acetyl-CoA acetyltransferase, partial [Desulfurococcales archaeon]|nr:acetyl-CoA acetyltransferase [Desulfurococcales archaeon]